MTSSNVENGPNNVSTSCDAEDGCQMLSNPSFMSNIDVDEIVEPTPKKTKTLISNVWIFFIFFCEKWGW